MEALLALLLWFDLGSWLSPTPAAPSTPERSGWATPTDALPGLPPRP